jgi:hypothetical protein
LQLVAIDNLANVAGSLGRWDEKAEWGRRMLDLADSIGALPQRARAQHHLAVAAQGQGDQATTLLRSEQALATACAVGDRRMESAAMQMLGDTYFSSGDTATALQWLVQRQALCRDLQDLLGECRAAALEAACDLRLGQPGAALSKVGSLLGMLGTDLAGRAAHQTIGLRWTCQQVLDALGDPRAEAMLEQLHTDVQAHAAALTDAADCQRLIQAQRAYRDIVAAWSAAAATRSA